MRKGLIKYNEQPAGELTETDEGFTFQYLESYLKSAEPQAVSLTLPLQTAPFTAKVMFPFFDGLIPEGWMQ